MFPSKGTKLQIMSHAVIGFPSLEENISAIQGLVNAGVKMIELQVPFTDPVADGPTLVNACHQALANGGSLQAALDIANRVSQEYPDVAFILMSYLNPIYQRGIKTSICDMAEAGIKGFIIPDLPVEMVEPYLPLCDELSVCPIMMVTPNTPEDRIKRIAKASRGLLYVVARQGVTGHQSKWDSPFYDYINNIRNITDLPLAVGFGVKSREDLAALKNHVEVAAVCSQYIEWQLKEGSQYAAEKMAHLTIGL